MNQVALILLLLTLAASPPGRSVDVGTSACGDLAWLSLPEALAVARAMHRPVLVYIQAAWCGPCRRVERETFVDPAVTSRLGRFVLTRLALDDRDRQHRIGPYRMSEAEWASRLGADATPTLVLLAPDGAVLGRQTGFLPPDGLLPILDAVLAEPMP